MKIITFFKTNNEGIVYASRIAFEEYEDKEYLFSDSETNISLSNEDIDKLITMLTELKEK